MHRLIETLQDFLADLIRFIPYLWATTFKYCHNTLHKWNQFQRIKYHWLFVLESIWVHLTLTGAKSVRKRLRKSDPLITSRTQTMTKKLVDIGCVGGLCNCSFLIGIHTIRSYLTICLPLPLYMVIYRW